MNEAGDFIPHTYEEKAFSAHLKTLAGKQCKILVSREFGIRSNQQNRYLWSVPYAMIAEEMGEEDTGIIHDQMRMMFWYELKEMMDENGNRFTARLPKETSSMTTVEFEEYAEKIRRWAASFLGLNIPLPNELIQEQMEE